MNEIEQFRIDVIASNLLIEREINFLVGVVFNNKTFFVKYRVKPIPARGSGLLDVLGKISSELPKIREKEKLVKELERFENLYKEANPLALITIKNIPYKFTLHKNVKDIPLFFYNKIEEFICALSLIFSAPIKPLVYILSSEKSGRKLIRLPIGGLTIEKYRKLYAKRNFKNLLENYLWKIIMKQRVLKDQNKKLNEKALRLKIALNFYRTALATTSVGMIPLGVGLRFVHYWTALEVLASGFKGKRAKERIKNLLSHYLPNENYPIDKWFEMRSSIVHNGKFKKGCNYSEASGKIRELIEKLILRMVES